MHRLQRAAANLNSPRTTKHRHNLHRVTAQPPLSHADFLSPIIPFLRVCSSKVIPPENDRALKLESTTDLYKCAPAANITSVEFGHRNRSKTISKSKSIGENENIQHFSFLGGVSHKTGPRASNQISGLQQSTNQYLSSRHVTTGSLSAERLENSLADLSLSCKFDVSFDDYKTAFSKKTKWELIRAMSVLWVCSFHFLSDHSLKLMWASRKLLGARLSEWLLKHTIYGQFVAGETYSEIEEAVSRLQAINVGPLLAAPMEDDVDSFHADADGKFEENLEVILNSMSLAKALDPVFPMIQMKITALMPGDLCKLLSERCPSPSQTPHVIESLASALSGQPVDVEKIFGGGFPGPMKHHLEKGIERVARVCQVSTSQEVMVMVDAEYTYLNPALNLFTLAMMMVCNDPSRGPPLTFYTYQNYLKSTKEILDRDIQFLSTHGVGFAAKMVRGAYMHSERLRASRSGLPDPVHDTYDDTSAAYDAAVTTVLEKMAAHPRHFRLIVASHNEASSLSAVKGIQQLGIDPKGGGVFFGQLMGMADHISCSLGVCGFLARKSLPYGPVTDTLPYLSRRAQENKAVLAGARRERGLLRAELRHRFKMASAQT